MESGLTRAFMWGLARSAADSLREEFGRPVQMLRFLDRGKTLHLDLSGPGRSIALSSVVAWHEWGGHPPLQWPRRKPGDLPGWRFVAGRYESFRLHRSEFERLGTCTVEADWACEIQSVEGLSASKSELTHFASLDAMVQTNSREMIDEVSESRLARNLAHDEIRILHRERTSDHFVRHLWDGRLFLVNSGGSHHFAAARYIAARLGRRVPLRGTLRTYGINAQAVHGLRRDYEMFAVPDEPEVFNAFHAAMQAHKASYLWHGLPRPCRDARVVFLPKTERRSARVASCLRAAGLTDVGAHLAKMVSAASARTILLSASRPSGGQP